MILYALYGAAIFFPCHPYIWSTTVLHDSRILGIRVVIVLLGSYPVRVCASGVK